MKLLEQLDFKEGRTLSMCNLSLAVSLGACALLSSTSVAAQNHLNFNTSGSHAQLAQASSPFLDGTYLYGESAQPEQIGQEYLIFQVRQGKILGAFYLPQSEFSCFSGTISRHQINLSIVDPYEQTTYTHAIPLQKSSSVAASVPSGSQVGLAGYHRLSQISTNDRRMLNICLEQNR